MKKLASLIVEKRVIILIVFAALAIAGLVLMNFVNINYDMTSYLPDGSKTKTGVGLMNGEFGETNAITVMLRGLKEEEKATVADRLQGIENISAVVYDADSADYNNADATRYEVSISGNSFAEEAKTALADIRAEFSGYDLYMSGMAVDNVSTKSLLGVLIIIAFIILLVILFIMCSSWVEPFLFIAAIGVAIFINMGTNALLPSVSDTTHMIAAVLQMVLSMDYSIMLIDRYRQEKLATGDKYTAMKQAISGGFLSIASSSVTTIVGLLCLVFMSFTIGMDMGIVLAKGVLISLICILFVLPSLILLFDTAIERTRKPVPKLKMKTLSKLSHRGRYVILALFVGLFVGGFMMKDFLTVEFSLSSTNKDKQVIDELFPPTNPVVVLYDNRDEDGVEQIIDYLEAKDGVKSVNGYANSLGRDYTARELAADMGMDASLLQMLYYYREHGAATGGITLPEFIAFIQNDVAASEQFAAYIDDDMLEQIDTFAQFADHEAVLLPRTAEDTAALAGMEQDTVRQLYLYYFISNGGVDSGSMTVTQLLDFLLDEAAQDPQFADRFDAQTLAQLETMRGLVDAALSGRSLTAGELAGLTGMDASLMRQLFQYAGAADAAVTSMTLPAFIDFIVDDVAADPQYAAQFDQETLAQLRILQGMAGAITSGQSLTAAEIAGLAGVEAGMIKQLFLYASLTGGSQVTAMTLPEFLAFVMDNVAGEPQFAQYFDEAILAQLSTMRAMSDAIESGRRLSAGELAGLTGMDKSMIDQLFLYAAMQNAQPVRSMTVAQFTDFIMDDVAKNPQFAQYFDGETLGRLGTMQDITAAARSGQSLSAARMAALLGMGEGELEQLYLYYCSLHGDTSSWVLSLAEFVDFIVDDVAGADEFAQEFDAGSLEQLRLMQSMINGIKTGAAYSAQELADMLAGLADELNADTLELMYIYYFSLRDGDSAQTMTLEGFLGYVADEILHDPLFESYFDEAAKAELLDARGQMDEGRAALVGEAYSRLIVATTLENETPEVNAFIDALIEKLESDLAHECFVLGDSAMANEMTDSFTDEFNFISIITAIAIFVVVMITFRSAIVPLILVLLIQTAVYITMGATYLQGIGIYYLALMIVQAILMGATIDYAILFTSYYISARKSGDMPTAVGEAYRGSIMTILTSASILVLVTFIIGSFLSDPTISQVCLTIAKGSFFATALVIFILPGVLCACDRLVCRPKKEKRS